MRRRSAAALLAVGLAACGGSPPPPTRASVPDPNERRVEAVVDGDTIRISPSFSGATNVRFLNIDAPEKGGDTQEPWAVEATSGLRRGRAVLYVLWPNVAHFEEYRAAQVAAQRAGLGIWQPGHRLAELPFEYRRRKGGDPLSRPVGDWFTRSYVPPADFTAVPVNNRVFFSSPHEAESAGFRSCPRDASGYPASCFGPAG